MGELNYFSSNLKVLADKYSQKKIAEDTGVSPASINNYLNKSSDPSSSFLLKLKRAYDINIDNFLTGPYEIAEKKELSKSDMRFVGDYALYYYDTNVYKGRVHRSTNILRYGILSVVGEGKGKTGLKVYAKFFDSRRNMEDTFKYFSNLNSDKKKIEFYAEQEVKYTGELETSAAQIFVMLKNSAEEDRCLIILNNPPSNNKYIGGLGTANSVARGREKMPCVQYIVVSEKLFRIPDGELYQRLALGISEVNVQNETNQLIALFKNLYLEDEHNPNGLNDFQKQRIISDSLENMLEEMIEANMFRFAKVSNNEDDRFFRMIRDDSYGEEDDRL